MRGVWPHEQDEERAFADTAAKHFADSPASYSYGGEPKAGQWLALRWGGGNDCVVVLKISDDHEPVNYYGLVREYTDQQQVSVYQLMDALRDLVVWNGKRGGDADELLPPEQQPKEIARAMRLLGDGSAS